MFSADHNLAEKLEQSEIVLIGCSAGGFNLVYDLILSMPGNFPLPVIVIIHRSRKYKSSIESLLHKRAIIEVKLAEDKEKIKEGTVYFAPSDYHLLLEPDGTFTLDDSEPVFHCRPAIDVTFESISDIYRHKVIGILLSGANEDGANGMAYIEKNNGLVIVQDPEKAEVSTMPEAAIKKCKGVIVLDNEQLTAFIDHIIKVKVKVTQVYE